MSEPIQLEWEPAEWPEKQPKWGPVPPMRGWSRLIEGVLTSPQPTIRVRIPDGVLARTIAVGLRGAFLTAKRQMPQTLHNVRIETRRSGEHIYVRRVE